MTSKTASYPELPDILTAFPQLFLIVVPTLYLDSRAGSRGGEYTNEPLSGKPYFDFFLIIFSAASRDHEIEATHEPGSR